MLISSVIAKFGPSQIMKELRRKSGKCILPANAKPDRLSSVMEGSNSPRFAGRKKARLRSSLIFRCKINAIISSESSPVAIKISIYFSVIPVEGVNVYRKHWVSVLKANSQTLCATKPSSPKIASVQWDQFMRIIAAIGKSSTHKSSMNGKVKISWMHMTLVKYHNQGL